MAEKQDKYFKLRVVIGIVLLIILVRSFGGGCDSHPSSGSVAIRAETAPYVTVWPTEESFSAGAGAANVEEFVRIKAESGTFGVARGTTAEILESTMTMRRVRITSGVHTGDSGWVLMEFVHEP
jgi:hypothetical protein